MRISFSPGLIASTIRLVIFGMGFPPSGEANGKEITASVLVPECFSVGFLGSTREASGSKIEYITA
jgi:hypothetical protein